MTIQPKPIRRHLLLAACLSTAPLAMAATTAFDITSQMGAGWNLGNTMESLAGKGTSDETAWGNPTTTQDMINFIYNAGFRTLRIPVAWDDNIGGGPNYTINSVWIDRVETIANYALKNNMYVIINVHHNYGWESTTTSNESAATAELKALWTQIATHFQGYDNHLIFEVMNEPKATINGVDDWTGNSSEYGVESDMASAALATIRGTGGNNSTRLVMIPTYCAGETTAELNGLKVPNDPMIAISIHAYFPFDFCMNLTGTTTFTSTDVDNLASTLKSQYLNKGIAVVLGEWGSDNKNDESQRVNHAGYYAKTMKNMGVPCLVWDNNNSSPCCSSTDNMGLFDRRNLKWYYADIAQAIIQNYGIPTPPIPVAAPLNQMLLEAENAQISGGAAVFQEASRSNGAYVNLEGGTIVWTDSLTKAGTYNIVLNMDSPYGQKTNTFAIDGDSTSFTVDSLPTYGPVTVATAVTLQPGKHTFTLNASWGWINVDYLQLTAPTTAVQNAVRAILPQARAVPGGIQAMDLDGIRNVRVLDLFGNLLANAHPSGYTVDIPLGSHGMVLLSFQDAQGKIVGSSKLVVLP